MFSAKGEQIVQNKVSIIVPVYKVERELDRCVQSLFKQTYKNLEIILVDDGSPDKCPELCENYAEMDKRVKVIHKENGGLSDARNAGLKQAFHIGIFSSPHHLQDQTALSILLNFELNRFSFSRLSEMS